MEGNHGQLLEIGNGGATWWGKRFPMFLYFEKHRESNCTEAQIINKADTILKKMPTSKQGRPLQNKLKDVFAAALKDEFGPDFVKRALAKGRKSAAWETEWKQLVASGAGAGANQQQVPDPSSLSPRSPARQEPFAQHVPPSRSRHDPAHARAHLHPMSPLHQSRQHSTVWHQPHNHVATLAHWHAVGQRHPTLKDMFGDSSMSDMELAGLLLEKYISRQIDSEGRRYANPNCWPEPLPPRVPVQYPHMTHPTPELWTNALSTQY
jgi:hypothetical protein